MSGLFGESNKNKDFVFEVEKDKFSSKRSRKYDKEAAEKEAMKNLLQFILDDDEDLALLTDSLVINKSLEPADNLDEAMALAIKDNETAEVIDLEIKIPLIVVETEQEAASLIQLYESSHAPVQRLD